MATKVGLRASIDGEECLYCHVVFRIWEAHPPSIEFINGYPAPCRNIGRLIYGPKNDEELPWAKSKLRYDPVYFDDEPGWMK